MPTIENTGAIDEVLQSFGLSAPMGDSGLTPSAETVHLLMNSTGASAQDILQRLSEIMHNSSNESTCLSAVRLALEVRKIIRTKDNEDAKQNILVVVKDGNVNLQNVLCPPGRL